MEENTRTKKESSRKRGAHDEKRFVSAAARINSQDPPITRPALAAYLEAFAKAVAGGSSRVAAAVICGRKEGSASYLYRKPEVKERIAELQAIARSATEKAVAEDAIRMRGAVDVGRNEIINRLAGIGRDATQPGAARVRAWTTLADIYMLRPRNVEDLRHFIGWTEDEIQEFIRTKVVPRRIAALTGYSTINDFELQPGPQAEKQ